MKTSFLTCVAFALLAVVIGCTSQDQPPAATTEPAAPAPGASSTPGAAPIAAPTAAPGSVPEVLTINANNPGVEVDIKAFIVPGQITVFDFYSEYCPPCMRLAPIVEKLATDRPDLVARKVDINRKGIRGIDWASPLARQYGLNSIPHFKIYAADGSLMAEGDPAYELIAKWAGLH